MRLKKHSIFENIKGKLTQYFPFDILYKMVYIRYNKMQNLNAYTG